MELAEAVQIELQSKQLVPLDSCACIFDVQLWSRPFYIPF